MPHIALGIRHTAVHPQASAEKKAAMRRRWGSGYSTRCSVHRGCVATGLLLRHMFSKPRTRDDHVPSMCLRCYFDALRTLRKLCFSASDVEPSLKFCPRHQFSPNPSRVLTSRWRWRVGSSSLPCFQWGRSAHGCDRRSTGRRRRRL